MLSTVKYDLQRPSIVWGGARQIPDLSDACKIVHNFNDKLYSRTKHGTRRIKGTIIDYLNNECPGIIQSQLLSVDIDGMVQQDSRAYTAQKQSYL